MKIKRGWAISLQHFCSWTEAAAWVAHTVFSSTEWFILTLCWWSANTDIA